MRSYSFLNLCYYSHMSKIKKLILMSKALIIPMDEIILKLSYLKAEVSELDAVISSVVLRQAEKISELESWVDPFSNGGYAVCNFFEVNHDD